MEDAAEQEWVNNKLQDLRRDYPDLGRFWVGAVDSVVHPGIYAYTDGVPFRMLNANWGDGEPNRPHTVKYEHCIALDSNFNPARFFDFDCYKSFGYICKTQGKGLFLLPINTGSSAIKGKGLTIQPFG